MCSQNSTNMINYQVTKKVPVFFFICFTGVIRGILMCKICTCLQIFLYVSLLVLQQVQYFKEYAIFKGDFHVHFVLLVHILGNKVALIFGKHCCAFGGISKRELHAQRLFSRFWSGYKSIECNMCVCRAYALDEVHLEEEIRQNPHKTYQNLAHMSTYLLKQKNT